MRLEGKVILVTASTRGIGAAIVRECAKEGATVYMAARRLEAAQAMADELNAAGGNVRVVYNDAYKTKPSSPTTPSDSTPTPSTIPCGSTPSPTPLISLGSTPSTNFPRL